MPAPDGARNTIGQDRRPRVRWRIRDARLTASTRLTSATWFFTLRRKAARCIALLFERHRQRRVEVVEHGVGTGRWHGQVVVDGTAHLFGAFALQRFFLVLVPGAAPRE